MNDIGVATMAKLPKIGVEYRFIDEREVTLTEIVASLGLKPLRKKAQQEPPAWFCSGIMGRTVHRASD